MEKLVRIIEKTTSARDGLLFRIEHELNGIVWAAFSTFAAACFMVLGLLGTYMLEIRVASEAEMLYLTMAVMLSSFVFGFLFYLLVPGVTYTIWATVILAGVLHQDYSVAQWGALGGMLTTALNIMVQIYRGVQRMRRRRHKET